MNRQLLKNIRSLRLYRGLSQTKMAELIGRNQPSFARFENGAKKTDFETLQKVAEVLEVDVCTLIHFHEEGVHESVERAGSKNQKLEGLKERAKYLRRLNDQLEEQIKDREEVIELLRAKGG